MLLLDALYINNSGGKVLLDYLVSKLHEKRMPVFYLLDARVKGSFEFLPPDSVLYLEASFWARHRFYKERRNAFSRVLCFGNIPPSIRLSVPVHTYFQNTVYFYTTREFSPLHRLVLFLKASVIRYLGKNTDTWWVQTEEVKNMLHRYWNISAQAVQCFPFYDDSAVDVNDSSPAAENESRDTFLYVSDGHPNKLHWNLLTAFRQVASLYPSASLRLTISQQYPLLLKEIESMRSQGFRIVNLGWCSKRDLQAEYQKASFLVYPSNMESFGLGLIEAAQFGMRILAADLPYVSAVIAPSLTIDQENPAAIAKAMLAAMQVELPVAKVVVENRVAEMTAILSA